MDISEFEKMKSSAGKTARDFKSRSKPEPAEGSEPEPETDPDKTAAPPLEKDSGLLSRLLGDKDRTIILALIILLMDEGGDQSLLLALFSLLM